MVVLFPRKKKKKTSAWIQPQAIHTFLFDRNNYKTHCHTKRRSSPDEFAQTPFLHLATKHTCRQGQEPMARHLLHLVFFFSFDGATHGFLDGPHVAAGAPTGKRPLLAQHETSFPNIHAHTSKKKLPPQNPGTRRGHRAQRTNPQWHCCLMALGNHITTCAFPFYTKTYA